MKRISLVFLALCMILTTALVPILADVEQGVIGFRRNASKKQI